MYFPIYSQDIIKSGGKQNVEELKVTENSEEMMAKNYAIALERMQNALKREAQIKIVKQMTERKKVDVCTEQSQCRYQHVRLVCLDFFFLYCFRFKFADQQTWIHWQATVASATLRFE